MSVTAKLTEYYGFQIARAYLSNHRSSAFKARLVADLIRSKGVVEALTILSLTPKRMAKVFEKLLRSALANALNNHGMEVEGLYLFKVVVNEAKTLKRYRPILRGRSAKIRKRGCHLEILLAQKILPRTEEAQLEEPALPLPQPPQPKEALTSSPPPDSSPLRDEDSKEKEPLTTQSSQESQDTDRKQERRRKKVVGVIKYPKANKTPKPKQGTEPTPTKELEQRGEDGTES